MMLHALASSMPPQSILWLAGENRSGIKSSAKRLDPVIFSRFPRSTTPGIAPCSELANPAPQNPFRPGRLQKNLAADFLRHTNQYRFPARYVCAWKTGQGNNASAGLPGRTETSGQRIGFRLWKWGHRVVFAQPSSCCQADFPRCVGPGTGIHTQFPQAPTAWTPRYWLQTASQHLKGSFDWIISNPPFHRGIRNDLDIARNFFARRR